MITIDAPTVDHILHTTTAAYIEGCLARADHGPDSIEFARRHCVFIGTATVTAAVLGFDLTAFIDQILAAARGIGVVPRRNGIPEDAEDDEHAITEYRDQLVAHLRPGDAP